MLPIKMALKAIWARADIRRLFHFSNSGILLMPDLIMPALIYFAANLSNLESKGISVDQDNIPFVRYLVWIGLHVILFATAFFSLRAVMGMPPIPTREDLFVFDTQYYYTIGHDGYSYDPTQGSDVAFFPAFAWLWRLTGLYTQGMALVNTLIYIFSLGWLARAFRFTLKETLLYASLPSLMFMYVVYSEPLFFLTFTLLLIGLKRDNVPLAVGGFFLCSITRSSVNVFVPAIILTLLLSSGNRRWLKMLFYVLASLAGIALVSYIQHEQTGEWFGFIKTQKYWQHELQWPRLPLWTWGGKPGQSWKEVIWLDTFALMAGLACIVVSAYYVIKWLKKQDYKISDAHLFSLFYLAGLTLLSLAMKGGGLFSLNRYLIPGAAFAILFSRFLRIKFTNRQLWQLCGLIFVLLMASHFFRHIRVVLLSLAVVAFIALLLLFHRPNFRRPTFWALYVIGCVLQVYLLMVFINCDWVG